MELFARWEGNRMTRRVQLLLSDTAFAAALRETLSRSGPWHVDTVDRPDFTLPSVVVVDETSFPQLPLPLPHPERVVLISPQDAHLLARAWDARLVSVVSNEDTLATIMLAIMAAALRLPVSRVISPKAVTIPASISPEFLPSCSKRCKSR